MISLHPYLFLDLFESSGYKIMLANSHELRHSKWERECLHPNIQITKIESNFELMISSFYVEKGDNQPSFSVRAIARGLIFETWAWL